MKTMEYCLDYILTELKINWDGYANERKTMECEKILIQFDLPDKYRKHEFFKRLINRLIKEGYAEFIINNSEYQPNDIRYYQENTIITIEGFYFINAGGYKKQKFNQELKRIATIGNIVILALAAVAAIVYAGWEIRKDIQDKKEPLQTICKPDTLLRPQNGTITNPLVPK